MRRRRRGGEEENLIDKHTLSLSLLLSIS